MMQIKGEVFVPDVFRETLAAALAAAPFGLVLEERQLDALARHWRMVEEVNEKFNLTAILDQREAALKHYWDSLYLAKWLKPGGRCLDLGSGAGFPGIPLAIACPESRWLLLDSLQKRCRFLCEAIADLGLNQVEVRALRAEDAGTDPLFRERFDLVAARAVTSLPVLLEYALPFLRVGGLFLAMKGPAAEDELTASANALRLLGGAVKETARYRLPFTEESRSLIVVEKIASTPKKYPRFPGLPKKSPL
ncbi:MAG: 16S rRNA (guanine(527)-N(7))-methyltransferase RsmG [Clostridiales bacterium]|nr:16S rRNA (guanine(527)-N(7))-methyltransferase RsmG [Clostridiales bacterium]